MNKWRRLQKQSMRRRMKRIRAIKAFLRMSEMRVIVAASLAHLNVIRATPENRFEGGEKGKALVMLRTFEESFKSIMAAGASIR